MKKNNFVASVNTTHQAMHWQRFKADKVECTLCPRHCKIKLNKIGACGVRGSVNGELRTYNYGKALTATEEVIETEAVNHYQPGSRILSMGNVGCMMNCSFCQNWETSQTQFLDPTVVRNYSAQQLVDICLENDIGIISWTYNDPVVWHEFVLEASALAQQNGIKTLYKSAFYIEATPVEELIECIDIFSLSLKSMSERFYRRVTKAKLQPVLDRIVQVANSDCHLEISQLVVPELNDKEEDIARTIEWVKQKIGVQVPLHFVAFHPAYKYTKVERTSLDILLRAREMALAAGIQYVYLGNANVDNINNSYCQHCDTLLVQRFGLASKIENLTEQGSCKQCGEMSAIKQVALNPVTSFEFKLEAEITAKTSVLPFSWSKEVQSVHVVRKLKIKKINRNKIKSNKIKSHKDYLIITGIGSGRHERRILVGDLDRFIISRESMQENGIKLSWQSEYEFQMVPLLDRAHFPVELKTNSVELKFGETSVVEQADYVDSVQINSNV